MEPLHQQWGKYRIRRLIARGGMAEVFEAKMIGPAGFVKPVCLKRVRPDLSSNPEFVEMFQNEARIAAMLHHANIVSVFDFDRHGEELFLVMELVEGLDLRAILKQAKKNDILLSPGFAVYIVDALLAALDHAHSREVGGVPRPVIHRDISPHNVLVSTEGIVKLADFGIAKSKGISNATRAGVIKGKLAYLSPEQLAGESVTPRSDLFSVGLVLAEMLTGDRLFKGDADGAFLERALNYEFVPIPNAPEPLNRLLSGLLTRHPENRYPTAKRVRTLLHQIPISPVSESEVSDIVNIIARSTTAVAPPQSRRERTAVASSREAKTAWAPMPSEGEVKPPAPASVEVLQHGRSPRRFAIYLLGIGVAIAIFTSAILYKEYLRRTSPHTPSTVEQRTGIETPNVSSSEAFRSTVQAPHALKTAPRSIGEPMVTIPVDKDAPNKSNPVREAKPRSSLSLKKTIGAHAKASQSPPVSSEEEAPVVPPKPGFVDVNVRPWATVVIDGRWKGTTPIRGLPLKPGRHRVVLENQPLGYREEIRIDVKSETSTPVTRRIEKTK